MPHLDMARKYTTLEVLTLLEDDEDLSDNEVLAEGSDEEFDDLNELEELEESCQEEWNGLETSEVHKNSSCLYILIRAWRYIILTKRNHRKLPFHWSLLILFQQGHQLVAL